MSKRNKKLRSDYVNIDELLKAFPEYLKMNIEYPDIPHVPQRCRCSIVPLKSKELPFPFCDEDDPECVYNEKGELIWWSDLIPN